MVGYVGIFTDSLVRALRSGYMSKETTYADLPFGLDECRYQTPVVSGRHKHARMWYQVPTSIKGNMRRWPQSSIVGFWFLCFSFSVLFCFLYDIYTPMWRRRHVVTRLTILFILNSSHHIFSVNFDQQLLPVDISTPEFDPIRMCLFPKERSYFPHKWLHSSLNCN